LECEYPYEIWKKNESVSSAVNYTAQTTIKFGPAFTANATSNITAKATNEILITDGTLLLSDNQFLARIEPVICPEIENLAARPANNPRASVTTSGAEGRKGEIVSIYPNPSNGVFKIESVGDAVILSVAITNIHSAKTL
jgi:hypothetical protein